MNRRGLDLDLFDDLIIKKSSNHVLVFKNSFRFIQATECHRLTLLLPVESN